MDTVDTLSRSQKKKRRRVRLKRYKETKVLIDGLQQKRKAMTRFLVDEVPHDGSHDTGSPQLRSGSLPCLESGFESYSPTSREEASGEAISQAAPRLKPPQALSRFQSTNWKNLNEIIFSNHAHKIRLSHQEARISELEEENLNLRRRFLKEQDGSRRQSEKLGEAELELVELRKKLSESQTSMLVMEQKGLEEFATLQNQIDSLLSKNQALATELQQRSLQRDSGLSEIKETTQAISLVKELIW